MAKKLFFVIGAPGSGKTTNASIIAKRHSEHIVHYSTGDMLRDEISSGSELGKRISSYIKKGELVPHEIIMHTVIMAIKYAPVDIVLIDGFPRSVEQMKAFDLMLQDEQEVELMSVIELKAGMEVAKERILDRALETTPGQKRTDDSEDVFYDRMAIYRASLSEIRSFYNSKKLLKVIDGEKPLDIVVSVMELFIMSRSNVAETQVLSEDSHRTVCIG